ncbi:MAG TPA: hypothetical protein VID04_02670, partial [Methylomirabilota bacterium]
SHAAASSTTPAGLLLSISRRSHRRPVTGQRQLGAPRDDEDERQRQRRQACPSAGARRVGHSR